MSGSGAGNTLRERVGTRRDRFRLWISLNVNRLVIAGVLTVGLFVFLLILGVLDASPVRAAIREGGTPNTIFRAYVGALITGVTLVVTIDQLVLSQETGPLGDQRDRMSGALDFRNAVEEFFGTTSPPEPNAFLQALVDAANERATSLTERVADSDNDDLQDDVAEFVESVVGNAETVSDELESTQFGHYDVVRAALDFNYGIKIYRARKLREEYANDLTDDMQEALDDLIDILEFFGPAREHIKTLFFQWELVNLSRQILYVSIPALAVSAGLFVYLDAGSFPGGTLGIDNLTWIFSAGIALASAPFLLLTAYILRIATIAKRTLAIGPFVLRESQRDE
jgi:predicted house-cleaning noncanonical NTP pyrophosphatase (MazG superfamily)